MEKTIYKLIILFTLSLLSLSGFCADTTSSFAGQENRKIKAISDEDLQGFLDGKGMGYGKTGELNHYPGPRHVLDLAKELNLSNKQIKETQTIFDQMHKDAVRVGKLIVAYEKQLDDLFKSQKITESKLHASLSTIGHLMSEYRFIHLRAHLQEKRILTQKQIVDYDRLRGYKFTAS